jgi:hypothetical protein
LQLSIMCRVRAANAAGSPPPRFWSSGRCQLQQRPRFADCLLRVERQKAKLVGKLVHARPGREVCGRLRAAVQHDHERQPVPRRTARGCITYSPARLGGGAEPPIDKCSGRAGRLARGRRLAGFAPVLARFSVGLSDSAICWRTGAAESGLVRAFRDARLLDRRGRPADRGPGAGRARPPGG